MTRIQITRTAHLTRSKASSFAGPLCLLPCSPPPAAPPTPSELIAVHGRSWSSPDCPPTAAASHSALEHVELPRTHELYRRGAAPAGPKTAMPRSEGNRDGQLASLAVSKGNLSSSATSVTSSDGRSDAHDSSPAQLDARSRASEDASSETSSHRRKMSKLFKGRKSRRKSMQSDTSASRADVGVDHDVPPVPDIKALADDARFHSDESLGLHKSVASSLLTDDSDAEA